MSAERSPHQVAVSDAMKRHWRKRKAAASPPPLRLVTENEPERDLQRRVKRTLDYLLLPPAVWFAMPVGHIQLTREQGAKLASIGQAAGLPDLFVIYGGQTYGIELKAHGGRLSKTRFVRNARGTLIARVGQEEVFPKLEAAGVRIAVCRSSDDVIDQLQTWGIPMRRAA